MKTKNATLFTAAVMLFLFVSPVFAATDPGSLEKAEINVLSYPYSTDYEIYYAALSGDGTRVALAYTWYGANGHECRISVSDVGGTAETVLVNWPTGLLGGIAINDDGSRIAVGVGKIGEAGGYAAEYPHFDGWLNIDTATGEYSAFPLWRGFGIYPEFNFDLGTVTAIHGEIPSCTDEECGCHSFRYTYLVRYDIATGALLERLDLGCQHDTVGTTHPYYLNDGRYLFHGENEPDATRGVYVLTPGTDLPTAVKVADLYYSSGFWDASGEDPQVVAVYGTDTVNLYSPVTSAARTLFVDDSGYVHQNAGATIRWVEMGLKSGYTFTADAGYHIVQTYTDQIPKKGRFVAAEDLGGFALYPSKYGQRAKRVSDDGTRILVELTSYIAGTWDKELHYHVLEFTGTAEETATTTTTTASADTTITTTAAAGECAPGCPDYYLGDTMCDDECNVAACNYDNGDCSSSGSTTSSVPGSDTTTSISGDTTGELGGDCYPNGTCNSGLICVYDTCLEASEGELGGACYPNGTCDVGLTCVDNVCVTETCSASMILGEDDPRLDAVRRFRDEILAENVAGRKIIEL